MCQEERRRASPSKKKTIQESWKFNLSPVNRAPRAQPWSAAAEPLEILHERSSPHGTRKGRQNSRGGTGSSALRDSLGTSPQELQWKGSSLLEVVSCPQTQHARSPSSQRFSLERFLPSKGSSKMEPFSLSLKVCRYMALFSILPLPAGHEGQSGAGWSRESRIRTSQHRGSHRAASPAGTKPKREGCSGWRHGRLRAHIDPHTSPPGRSILLLPPPSPLPFPGSPPLTHPRRTGFPWLSTPPPRRDGRDRKRQRGPGDLSPPPTRTPPTPPAASHGLPAGSGCGRAERELS